MCVYDRLDPDAQVGTGRKVVSDLQKLVKLANADERHHERRNDLVGELRGRRTGQWCRCTSAAVVQLSMVVGRKKSLVGVEMCVVVEGCVMCRRF